MILDPCFVKELLGGKWPTVPGCEDFAWDDVAAWHCKEGLLLPSNGEGGYMLGPMLRLKPFDAGRFLNVGPGPTETCCVTYLKDGREVREEVPIQPPRPRTCGQCEWLIPDCPLQCDDKLALDNPACKAFRSIAPNAARPSKPQPPPADSDEPPGAGHGDRRPAGARRGRAEEVRDAPPAAQRQGCHDRRVPRGTRPVHVFAAAHRGERSG